MKKMYPIKNGRLFTLITLVLLLMFSGCSGVKGSQNASYSGKTYEVTPGFREFYDTLGGEEFLGPAISQDFVFEEFECQYTVNVLMCLNPTLSGSSRFGLYPLGNALNVRQDPAEIPPGENTRVVNGYNIYEEFIAFFDQLSGVRFAGNPISPVHINYSQQRVEQFFENVGFYRNFNDPPGKVKLLAYGALACDTKCSYSPSIEALIINPEKAADNQPFLPQLGKIGGATVFGEPLTQPYIADDGAQEQIYTNAVLYSPVDKPSQVLLRPLPLNLGMLGSEPGPQLYGNQNGVVFYAVDEELGYHVPLIFDAFVSAHGGLNISGNPISETIEYEVGLYRQCFENYCLDYRPSNPEDQQVAMAPLGKLYLDTLQAVENQEKPFVISNETVEIQLTEQYKKLPPTSPQRIDILVISRADQKPLPGIESDLDITLPDGTHYTSDVAATLKDGTASVIIPAMNSINNGSILMYKICLKAASAKPVCASSSYLIWNSP